MSLHSFQDRLAVTEESLARTKGEVEGLEKELQDALAVGNASKAIEVQNNLAKKREKLEDLIITKTACQSKISSYQKNASEGKKLVSEIGALDEKRRPIVNHMIKSQEEVGGWLSEVDAAEVEIRVKAQKFEELTGEPLSLPASADLAPARLFAGSGAPGIYEGARKIQPLPAWKSVSNEERMMKHKEELDKKLKVHEARIETAEKFAPNCPNCERANVETKMVVDRRSGRSDTPGATRPPGHWCFICAKCGARQTQGIPETRDLF